MRVALSQRVIKTQSYSETRDALSQDWTLFLQSLNLNLFPIPNQLKCVKTYLDIIQPDLLILTGGNTVSPVLYGDKVKKLEVDDIAECRDYTEKEIIHYSLVNRIPLLGVCRGMQMLQVFFGGRLSCLKNEAFSHVNAIHDIFMDDSIFSKRIGVKKIRVNSYHQQGILIKQIATPLRPFAICEESQTVEGFFHPEYPIMGIMWHPERDNPAKGTDLKIIEHLLQSR